MSFEENFKIIRPSIFVMNDETALSNDHDTIEWIETIQISYPSGPILRSFSTIEISNCAKLTKIMIDNHVQIDTLKIKSCKNLKHIDLSKNVDIETLILEDVPDFTEIRLENKATIHNFILDENVVTNIVSFNIMSYACIQTLTWGNKMYQDITSFHSKKTLDNLTPLHGYTIRKN